MATTRTDHLGPSLLRSTDAGRTWGEASRPAAFHTWDPVDGSCDHEVWETWCEWPQQNTPDSSLLHSVNVDTGDPDTAWVFPMDGTEVWPRTSPDSRPAAYVTRDAGATWQRCDDGLPDRT
ncbi:MAG: hypothetical protein M5U19_18970 [Microthrixaceae bacterium]|nr:hypothetical protein [Microthrixaceae bacterium]